MALGRRSLTSTFREPLKHAHSIAPTRRDREPQADLKASADRRRGVAHARETVPDLSPRSRLRNV